MKNPPAFTRILSLILSIASAAAPLAAHADPESDPSLSTVPVNDYKNYKVVGRGVFDKETKQVLQLACVGRHVEKGSLERECTTLNFLLSEVSGQQRLVGKPFEIGLNGEETVKTQLKKELKRRRLYEDALQNSRVMLNTRSLFMKGSEGRVWRTIAIVFGGMSAVAGLPALVAVGIGLGVPLIADLFVLPFALIEDAQFDTKALGANTEEALRDRAKFQWQVHPQKMRTKRFQRLLGLLTAEGTDLGRVESLDQQVKETQEDIAADEKERQTQIDTDFPAYGGDVSDVCFVDSIEVKRERSVIGLILEKKALEGYSKSPSVAAVNAAVREKLGIAAELKKHGFVVDEVAVIRNNGSRGSKFTFEVSDHIFAGRIGSETIESTLERSSARQGRVTVKMENVRSVGEQTIAQDVISAFNEAWEIRFPNCADMKSGKSVKFNDTFF